MTKGESTIELVHLPNGEEKKMDVWNMKRPGKSANVPDDLLYTGYVQWNGKQVNVFYSKAAWKWFPVEEATK